MTALLKHFMGLALVRFEKYWLLSGFVFNLVCTLIRIRYIDNRGAKGPFLYYVRVKELVGGFGSFLCKKKVALH